MTDTAGIYASIRRHGHIVPLLAIALSLVVDLGGAGLIAAFLAACVLTSRGRSITDSIQQFNRQYRSSDAGRTYIIIVIYTSTCLFTAYYHHDDLGSVETAVKQLVIAYAVLFHFEKYDAKTIFLGAALGAVLSGGIAIYDHYFLNLARAGGVTNPVRFGSIAAIFAALSLIGLLFASVSRWFAILMGSGVLGGLAAAFLSGSMSTAITIPPMLLLVFIRLWNLSRIRAVQLAVTFLATFTILATADIGPMRERIGVAFGGTAEWSKGEVNIADESVRLRMKMLGIAGQLFREHPILGVGSHGWNDAVATEQTAGFDDSHLENLNQAHNQLANDLARGGLLRAIAGLAILLLPTFFFIRSKPFSTDAGTVPALAGLVTCIGFAFASLTESVMLLSLPASIYAVLICFLVVSNQNKISTAFDIHSKTPSRWRSICAWGATGSTAVVACALAVHQYRHFSTAYDPDFDRGATAYTFDLTALSPIQNSPNVTAAGGVLKISGQQDIYSIGTFSLNPGRQYGLSARVRAVHNDAKSGESVINFGLVTYNRDGKILDRYLPLAIKALKVGESWVDVSALIGGRKSGGIDALKDLKPDINHVRLVVVTNYRSAEAVTEIDYLRFERNFPAGKK